MSCKDKIKLTPEEEKLLNKQILDIMMEAIDIVQARFPKEEDKPIERGAGDDYPIIPQ